MGQLLTETTWANAKRELITQLERGSVEEEAWNLLRQLTRGDKDIVDLGAKTKKLVKKDYPGQAVTAARLAFKVFIHALEPKLVLEVRTLGHNTLSDITAAAQKIKWL